MLLCILRTHFISAQGHSSKLDKQSTAEAAAGGKWWVIKRNKSQGVQLCLIVVLPREHAPHWWFVRFHNQQINLPQNEVEAQRDSNQKEK